jgi:hypothetical protein
MQGLFLLAFFVAIIVIVYWAWANDSVPIGGRTKGFLRMPFTEKPTEAGGTSLTSSEKVGTSHASEHEQKP